MLFLAFFLRLDDSILLKLNQTVLLVPWPEADKPERSSLPRSVPEVLSRTTAIILNVPVGPIRSDGVLVEKTWGPGFLSSLPGLLPLSFLQHKLLLRSPQLVSVFDSAGHVLPQSVRGGLNDKLLTRIGSHNLVLGYSYSLATNHVVYLSDSNSPC